MHLQKLQRICTSLHIPSVEYFNFCRDDRTPSLWVALPVLNSQCDSPISLQDCKPSHRKLNTPESQGVTYVGYTHCQGRHHLPNGSFWQCFCHCSGCTAAFSCLLIVGKLPFSIFFYDQIRMFNDSIFRAVALS